MSTEEQSWKILGEYFKQYGFVKHQTETFDNFIEKGISKIVTEEPDILIVPKEESEYKSYKLSFKDVYIPSPTVIEETRELREFTPSEARNRDLTYDSPVYVTIIETLELHNGNVEVNEYVRVVLGRIPIMIRSNKCYLSKMTPFERIKAHECQYDEGGYFIIKGKERVLIAQLRNIYNIPLVLEQKSGSKTEYICEMRSMSEETGHSVLIKVLINTNTRYFMFSLPYIKEPIPIGIVFKALGYTCEEIINFIGLYVDDVEKYFRIIINDSFFVEDQTDGFEYFKINYNNENNDNLELIWNKMETKEKNIWKNKSSQYNSLKYIGTFAKNPQKECEKHIYAQQVVENEIFPHMGVTSTNLEKAYLLGHMVHKLLATVVGIRNPDDRDNYIYKRVESSGILCYELFRQLFKKYTGSIISQIEKKKQLPHIMSIIPRLSDITKGFIQCFSKGNWGVPKASYVKPGVAQILSRLSYGATLSNLRRVAIPKAKESKNAAIRQIHPSQIMFICPTETPEGQPVGIVLNLSLLTRISDRIPTVLIREIVESCDNIISINNFNDNNEYTKVFLNGILLGISKEPYDLIDELKKLRNMKLIPWCVSISYDDLDEEVHICSDDGRLLRPVFNVENDKILYTNEDGTNWDELIDKNIISYIDNIEANNAVIAFNTNELKKYKNDYCEIAPAMMLGVMANIIPFPDHSQSPRNTYQAAMGKQAMSMFALSYLQRTDTIVHILNTPQRPLVSTKTSDMMGFNDMPAGINAIVAIACYTGFNQEDSVIINYSAIQRGLFWATTYKTHSMVENKDGYITEKIGTPPLNVRRHDVNYGLLDENGIIKQRHPIWYDEKGIKRGGDSIYVKQGDVIIGKVLIKSCKETKNDITDTSEVIKKGDEGYIDRIYTSITPNGYKLVKVVIRKVRIPEIGDKFASRAAQKGTVGMVYSQADMPFTPDGICPDIIINPHCIPSRMTINQLMESVLGKVCACEGEFGDSTPFTSSSIPDPESGDTIADQICKKLGMQGYCKSGNEILTNGMTGEIMGNFFIGPVYYQRLKHLVSDKMHARDTGPVTTLTRQPLEGRSREGGSKCLSEEKFNSNLKPWRVNTKWTKKKFGMMFQNIKTYTKYLTTEKYVIEIQNVFSKVLFVLDILV